ncbi:zinc finger BED domain-containing protein RICESLEEPER 2-like [Morus notabilis]|uniref:zinc finger BED domain-containing protein RICESLEEPER 2-like n=1 Tax=Morus notabilis TaxID=981085 RepID=UPI000CED51CF|nr:zinc finger BED domain-containing protein RICESLEEPER 2-like [Morus notabilis]
MEIDLESIESQSVDVEVEEIDGSSFNTQTQGAELQKRKRKLTSKVWSHFVHLPLGPDKKLKAKCKHCIGQMLIAQEAGAVTLGGSKYDPEKFCELVVAAIIMHDLPFSFVEYAGIRSIFQYLHPQIQLVSRNTAKADALKFYKREKLRLKLMLETIPGQMLIAQEAGAVTLGGSKYDPEKFCELVVAAIIMHDLPFSFVEYAGISDGYVCLTAHFIDKNWNLQKRVLNFSFMPPPHSGIALSEKLYAFLSEWGIENKVFSVTLDNASTNGVSVDMLREQLVVKRILVHNGDLFHMRCCAHILNLVVQDGLKQIDDSIVKIRDSVKYVKGSQKGLCQDVPTRWNSTYLMLESALYYRRVFQHLELSDSNYKHCPSSAEWDKVEKIKTFLKLFYDATLKFSGTKYPTANLYFPSIWHCCFMLKQYLEGDDEYLKYMATAMWGKFQKYWSQFHLTLAIACVLDPRFKLRLIEFSYKKLYGDDCVECISMRSTLYSIFEEYNEFDEIFLVESTTASQKSELDLYLDEPRLARTADLDILSFWKSNQFRYPALASMACDILAVSVSTIASEATFSVGGRVLDSFRSSLKPKTVEALVCTRDWLYGDKDFNEEVEDFTQDIFNFSLKEEEPFSQGSISPERNDAPGVSPLQQII